MYISGVTAASLSAYSLVLRYVIGCDRGRAELRTREAGVRRFVLVLFGGMLAIVTFFSSTSVPSTHAQSSGWAYGSCGAQWGEWDHDNLTPELYGDGKLMTVPDVKFEIVWRDIGAPTRIGVIGRLNNDLDATIGVWSWVAD